MSNFECNLEGPKIEKKVAKNIFGPNFEVDAAVSAALGGRIIGWGEGKFGFNLKPSLKIDL